MPAEFVTNFRCVPGWLVGVVMVLRCRALVKAKGKGGSRPSAALVSKGEKI